MVRMVSNLRRSPDLLHVSIRQISTDFIASRQRVSKYDKKPKIACFCGESAHTLRTLIRCGLCEHYSHLNCMDGDVQSQTANFICKSCLDNPYIAKFKNLVDLQ